MKSRKPTMLKWWISVAVLVCVAVSAGPALAQTAQAQGLAAVGPTNPANGFATWYQDRQGLTLEQCLVSPNDPAAPGDPCALAGTLPAGDASSVVFPSNFPDEFFWWSASAVITPVGAGGAGKATLVHALEGAFGGATGTPADGDGAQIVFARFRIRVTGGLTPGATYTVTHPYGVNTFVASDTGTINFTDDFGCAGTPPACDFASVLPTSNVGPFLRWDPAVPPAAPAGFIGDPNVDHAITGSPFGTNVFRIEGPNIGGTGINVVETNQFGLLGKLFNGTGVTALTIDRTTYLRNANTSQINVFVHSSGNATVTASGTGIPTTTLTGDPNTGRFFARILLGPNAALPAFITITASSAGNTSTTRDNPLVDEVTVDSATYNVTTQTLTIQAHSSDQTSPPTLTAEGSPLEPLGTLTSGTLAVPMTVPPGTVTVTSSAGGKDSRTVDIAAEQVATTLSLGSSANPSVFGQPVTFTATVNGGTGTPTGTVTFRDGSTVLGVINVANRTASITVSTLSAGTHSITAVYSGDAVFATSTSATVSQVVNRANTTTSLIASPNPVARRADVTLTATVTAVAPGAGTPTGTVTFRDGTTVIGTATLNASGVATLVTSFGPPARVHSITATYAVSTNFNASTSTALALTVQ